MIIKLRGENKKDVRNQIHELESKGIAIIKCIDKVELNPQFVTDGKVLKMTFKAENQYATITELNLNNEASIVKEVAKITETKQTDIKRMLNHVCPSYSKCHKTSLRLETLIENGFSYVYVDNGYKFIY